MSVFVDTGVMFGISNPADGKHTAARRILSSIEGATITTDHVVVECWGLLNRKLGRHAAMTFWRGLRFAPLHLESVTPGDLERAEAIGGRWPDQTFSFVDCTSFALMERVGCDTAASFDADFAIYRYGADRAFRILR